MPEPLVVAALIPARKGSKGVPGKNTTPINGHSLVERAILCARAVPDLKGRIYVSTDDADAALQAGLLQADVIERPDQLAADDTPMVNVVLHAVRVMNPKPDILVLLQPTTPSRTWQIVQDAIQMLSRSPHVDSVVSVTPVPKQYSPDVVMTLIDHELQFYSHKPATRRQDATPTFCRDGSVYATRVRSLLKTGSIYGNISWALPVEPSRSLNVDTQAEWERAHTLLR